MEINWRQTLITAEHTIAQAIEVIEKGSLKIAAVVDAQDKLIGIVTDGDVRRGLLKHVRLDSAVSTIMNTKPMTVAVGTPKERIKALMEESEVLQMPVVDQSQILIGLETLAHLNNPQQFDNVIFLMAGGRGQRLYPLTENCPKPLLKVGDKPILETIILNFVKQGFHNFTISVCYKSQMLKDYFGDGSQYGISIRYVEEDAPLGTAGALGLLPSAEGLPVIMMNGDLLTRVDFEQLLADHQQKQALVTMGVRRFELQVPYGTVESDEHQVCAITEKPTQNFFINAGIYVLDPDVITRVKRDEHLDMPQFLNTLIAEDKLVSMFPIHEYWLDIGQINDFKQAQIDMMQFF